MAAYFSGTLKALRGGATRMSARAAIKNIEHWEEALEDVDVPGVKGIVRDLGALKKCLEADDMDHERIGHLMARLGKATRTIAGRAEDRFQDKIEEMGDALIEASESQGDEDERDGRRSSSRAASSRADDRRGSSSDGRGEVRDPEHDGRLKQNRDRGVSMQDRHGDDDDDDRGVRSRSSRSGGQGEVRDPEHDGRLRQNRDRGVSMRDHDDDDEHEYRNGSRRPRQDDDDRRTSARYR